MQQETVRQIYDEISELQIELEPDPTVLGALYINGVISKCRNHLNKVARIRLRLSQERRYLKTTLAAEETFLSASMDRLLAEDDVVRRQPNVRDREALARTMLREQINKINVLKNSLLDLDTVEQAVKMVHEELIRTSNEIKTQRSLLNADRSTGAGYGDEADRPRRVPDDIDEAELDRILNEPPQRSEVEPVQQEAPEPTLEVAQAQETPQETPQEALPEAPAQALKSPPAPNNVGEDAELIDQFLTRPQSPQVSKEVPVQSESAKDDEEDFSFLDAVPAAPKATQTASKATQPKPVAPDSDDDFLAGILQNI